MNLEEICDDDAILQGTLTGPKSTRAFEFLADGWKDPEWLPYSATSIIISEEPGRAEVYVRKWLARKNGW